MGERVFDCVTKRHKGRGGVVTLLSIIISLKDLLVMKIQLNTVFINQLHVWPRKN